MRIFAGLFPPESVRRDIHLAVQAEGPPRGRWVESTNLHVTLGFLGEIDHADLPLAEAALRDAAASLRGFTAELGGLGVFGGRRGVKVAFLEMSEGEAEVTELARRFVGALPVALRPDEHRRFHAHLTLARFPAAPAAAEMERLTQAMQPLRWRFPVRAISLVESHLAPTGPTYRERCQGRLGD